MAGAEDKRNHPRYEMRGKVRYRVPEQMEISMASIKNVSAGGLCLLAETKIRVGQKLSLEFALPGDTMPIFSVGEVRWVETLEYQQANFKYRMGVHFLEISEEKRAQITKLIVSRLRSQVREEAEKDGPRPAGEKKLTILVIDDDKTTLHIVKDIFKNEYRVLTAASGPKGIELAKEFKPDVILLDIIMPDMDGFTTLMLLKDFPETTDIPVIILSVVRDKTKVFQAIQHGARDYMIKPFTSETLLHKIRNLCEKNL